MSSYVQLHIAVGGSTKVAPNFEISCLVTRTVFSIRNETKAVEGNFIQYDLQNLFLHEGILQTHRLVHVVRTMILFFPNA